MSMNFYILDVFAPKILAGNQLAVFPNATDIPRSRFAQLAREMNYSETTFVLPAKSPEAAAAVRIFTPHTELPFAGHPTLGTAFLLSAIGLAKPAKSDNTITLELKAGLVRVAVETKDNQRGRAVMEQPVPQSRGLYTDTAMVAASLCLNPEDIAAYPPEMMANAIAFLIVPLKSMRALERAKPNGALIESLLTRVNVEGLICFTTETVEAGSQAQMRAFFPTIGINEDPATGSAQGPLATYFFKHGLLKRGTKNRLVVEQGYQIGRPSKLTTSFEVSEGVITSIKVGGDVMLVAKGEFLIS
ncbi:MAG: PhzF family phenazine biosynthesis protein [Acidobacteriota bacterium]